MICAYIAAIQDDIRDFMKIVTLCDNLSAVIISWLRQLAYLCNRKRNQPSKKLKSWHHAKHSANSSTCRATC